MTHPEDKAVREKLVARGASALTDAELLSILLGDGPERCSSLQLAAGVLAAARPLSGGYPGEGFARLGQMDLQRLRMLGGMGVKRAAMLAAALETGRRTAVQNAMEQRVIAGDEDVAGIFRPMLAALPHEEFWAVYLSSANHVIDKVRVSQGGVSGTVVDHRLIVKRALECLCTSMVVVHNHPSGVARPSPDDIALTSRLQEAAALFDIALLDHIIVVPAEHFSFRKAALIK